MPSASDPEPLDPPTGSPPVNLTGRVRDSRLGLAAVVAVGLVLHVWGIGWGLPNMPESWAPDEFSPLRIHEAIAQRFSGGWLELYPPMHVYVLALALAPIEALSALGAVDFASPRVYSTAFYTMRFVSVAMAAGILLLVFAIARELFDPKSAVLSAATAALMAPLAYYAKIANVDVPFVFWLLLSLLHLLRIIEDGRWRDYVAFATFAAFAIGTKDQAAACYPLLPAAMWLAERARLRRAGHPRPAVAALFHPRMLGAGAIGVLVLAAIHNLPFNWTGAAERLEAITGPMTAQMQEFPNTQEGHLRMIALGVRHVQFSLGWPLFLVSAAGAGFALSRVRRDPRPLVLLAPIVSYWLFLIVPIMYHFDRYLLPVAVIASVFAGPVLAFLIDRRHRWAPLGIAAIIAVLGYSFAYASSVNTLIDADSRYLAEDWMKRHVPADSRIMVVGYSLYLPRFDGVDALTTTRPTIDELDAVDPEYLVTTSLFDERRFRGDPESTEFFRRLRGGTAGYSAVFVSRRQPRWNLLGDFSRVRSNLDKINPTITVYRRVRPPE
ncbi:MAG TPA: glycosyltransferase family 39 protein [Vicinamibacterales bacterium]|nr:glycosyltransferase family 39 protein [Vicinamibacterales bacterium]